jgi:hypothetical protein
MDGAVGLGKALLDSAVITLQRGAQWMQTYVLQSYLWKWHQSVHPSIITAALEAGG